MSLSLHTAANGHLTLNLNEMPDAFWHSLADRLVNHHGFQRVGSPDFGLDERIHPDFQCADFILAAGWDIWSGHYLLSDSMAGDAFLHQLFDRLRT